MKFIKISIRAMSNGRYKWQADTRKSPADMCTMDNIGGGLYSPDTPDYPDAASAAIDAQIWAEEHQPK